MHKIIILSFIILLSILSTTTYIHAQNSPQDYLRVHNAARADVGVAALVWNNSIAALAQSNANSNSNCSLTFSNQETFGENIANSNVPLTGQGAVELWVAEKPNYNYTSNSCIEKDCHAYTQVVWNKTLQLGCGGVSCSNGWWFFVCFYDPPGNVKGQRPF